MLRPCGGMSFFRKWPPAKHLQILTVWSACSTISYFLYFFPPPKFRNFHGQARGEPSEDPAVWWKRMPWVRLCVLLWLLFVVVVALLWPSVSLLMLLKPSICALLMLLKPSVYLCALFVDVVEAPYLTLCLVCWCCWSPVFDFVPCLLMLLKPSIWLCALFVDVVEAQYLTFCLVSLLMLRPCVPHCA